MTNIKPKNRREAFKILGGLLVCGGASLGIVHYAVRDEASADETVKLGPISEFPTGEFQKRLVTVTEHGTWFSGPVEKTLWIRRNADETFLVFTGTCPHMNCIVNEAPGQTFACPCHQSSFLGRGRHGRPLAKASRHAGIPPLRGWRALRPVPELQERTGKKGTRPLLLRSYWYHYKSDASDDSSGAPHPA
jgi:Rieske Fe-S protein